MPGDAAVVAARRLTELGAGLAASDALEAPAPIERQARVPAVAPAATEV